MSNSNDLSMGVDIVGNTVTVLIFRISRGKCAEILNASGIGVEKAKPTS